MSGKSKGRSRRHFDEQEHTNDTLFQLERLSPLEHSMLFLLVA
jgi:hypothetical protein